MSASTTPSKAKPRHVTPLLFEVGRPKSKAPKKTTKAAAKKRKKSTKAAPAKEARSKKLGVLGAAAKVLASASKPMHAQEIVDSILAKGLWQTKGKTPAATLYAAMIREIAAKGKDARFKKTDRGQFAARKAA